MKLRLAIQKSGRLHDDSIKLLKECGIDISNGLNKLKAEASNFPIEVYFLRDDDIPQYVEDGVADIGIVGENVVYEKNKPLTAVRKSENYTGLSFLEGKKVATSYPVILSKYLKDNGVAAEVHEISGSVEIAPSIGLADAICDLVSSGSTLFSNGLKEAETILVSEAVLVATNLISAEKQAIIDRLLFRIESVKKARNTKYILLNAPNDKLPAIIALLPGMKSPTVLPLAEPGWSSVHSVLNENDFWEIIEQLKAAGAQGILVVPIEKMVI